MAANPPTVTVCVPTIGRAATLEATLESVRRQTFADYELILLDNAAPEGVAARLDEYARSDSRAKVLRSPTRIPMFENFQRGIDAASGRYLAYFHDDDIYADDFLARHVDLLEANPHVAFAGGNCTIIDAEGQFMSDRALIRRTEVWSGWRYITEVFSIGNNIFPMQSIMFRRAALGPQTFDSGRGAHFTDYFILMRLAENADVGLIDARLLQLRTHDGQASRSLTANVELRLRTRLFEEYADGLLARRPERAEEIRKLRRQVSSARRSAAVWMWLQATDRRRASDARWALEGSALDVFIRGFLGLLDRSGLARLVRSKGSRRYIRSVAFSIVGRGRGR